MIIVPAIVPETFEEIIDKIYVIGDYSKLIQIGICDGLYGLRHSWLPVGKEILPDAFLYEFDLMVTEWKEYVIKSHQLGAKRVVVHVDRFTYDDYEELFSLVHQYDMTLGLTVSNDISVDILIFAARKLEESPFFTDHKKVFIQVTGVKNLSSEEHPFDERVIARIRVLKNFFPLLTIQVSGRMNPETAKLVKYAGADRLVIGSYIFGHEDVDEAIKNLKNAIAEEMVLPIKTENKEPIILSQKEKTEVVVQSLANEEPEVKKPTSKPSTDDIVYASLDEEFNKK